MTTLLPQVPAIVYPSSDGELLAETSVHVDAIIDAVVVLRQHLNDQPAIVLADQFLYYTQGYPRLRVAPDIMVVLSVTPGPRDNYKLWEEGQIPVVIFEITSEVIKSQDQGFKKTLYEQLEVQEYWQFDPKGEWIEEQLRGFRLRGDRYEPITDRRIEPLQLQLEVDGQRIAFYREDTGEKLLASSELAQALREEVQSRLEAEERAEQERQRANQERQRADQAEAQVAQLKERLRSMGIDPETTP
ncbi:MAG: Uma2 family endonuclease [Stenomitos rutilans HA7619-LM2]|jgi:hypothetical protein|nr:Uma2 family endonuclease [Stenomitos rutilans HA7619-LM2]